MWEGSLVPDFFEKAFYERFSVESKSDVGAESGQQVNIIVLPTL